MENLLFPFCNISYEVQQALQTGPLPLYYYQPEYIYKLTFRSVNESIYLASCTKQMHGGLEVWRDWFGQVMIQPNGNLEHFGVLDFGWGKKYLEETYG